LIKGCIGFTYIKGRLTGMMLLVRGKRVIEVSLPYPLYLLIKNLYRRKNILGKFLFKNSTGFDQLEKS